MPERLLQATLEHLNKRFAEQCELVESTRRATELELTEIRAALNELEQRRQDCLVVLNQSEALLQSLTTDLHTAHTHAASTTLQEGIENLKKLEQAAQLLQDLESERQALLAHHPDLNEAWQSYQANSVYLKNPQALEAIPSALQAALLREAERIEQRVAPILELESKALARFTSDRVVFHFFIIRESVSDLKMLWVAPVLQEVLDTSGSGSTIARDLLHALDNAVVELARAAEWIVEGATRQTVAGLVALQVEALYLGQRSPSGIIAELIRQQLAISPVFQLAQPNIYVVEITPSIWQTVINLIPSLIPADLVTAPVMEQMKEIPPAIESLSDLFSDNDLRAWSAKVAPDSTWGLSARRLRMIFMRLLAHGCVGKTSLEANRLWQGLPDKHTTAFQDLIPLLVEAELLVEGTAEDEKGRTIAINPGHLHDIQSLINREPSPVWGAFIQT